MKKISEPIVFFGSGPVAAKSLRLLAQNFEIKAVVTKPTTESEMSAAAPGVPLFTVQKKSELDELITMNPFPARLAVLIDFGIIVSQNVIDYFPLGIVNSHFSLLPEWRGADPITFAILSGQKQTGVSLMLLVEAMDEGPLLAQSTFDIPGDYTTPQLTDALITLSNDALRQILPLYISGKTMPAPQEVVTMATNPNATYSRKLTKEDGIIDWNKPAEQLEREIRAFAGWPKSRTRMGNVSLTIIKASVAQYESTPVPGQMILEKKRLLIGTGKDCLELITVQPDGKKVMPIDAFLAGYRSSLAS